MLPTTLQSYFQWSEYRSTQTTVPKWSWSMADSAASPCSMLLLENTRYFVICHRSVDYPDVPDHLQWAWQTPEIHGAELGHHWLQLHWACHDFQQAIPHETSLTFPFRHNSVWSHTKILKTISKDMAPSFVRFFSITDTVASNNMHSTSNKLSTFIRIFPQICRMIICTFPSLTSLRKPLWKKA